MIWIIREIYKKTLPQNDHTENEQNENSAICLNFEHKIWNKKRKKVKISIAIFCGMVYNMWRNHRRDRYIYVRCDRLKGEKPADLCSFFKSTFPNYIWRSFQ